MAKRKKRKMPAGTYWDDKLDRYVEPGEPEYSKERFRELMNGAVARDQKGKRP